MTVPVHVEDFDWQQTSGPGRLLCGPVKTGSVTYDVDYGVFGRWIYVGTSGDLTYMKYDGTLEFLPNMISGVWHPILSIRILSSGTDIPANQLRWGN